MDLKNRFHFLERLRKIRTTKPLIEFKAKEAACEVTRAVSKAEREFVTDPDFTRSKVWDRLRTDVLEVKERICVCCYGDGRGVGGLNVDHIRNRKDYPQLALLWSNLQLLCVPCNRGKGNRYNTDWEARGKSAQLYTLTNEIRSQLKTEAPEWNADALVSHYHQYLRKKPGTIIYSPDKAFLGWVKKFTKGLPPSSRTKFASKRAPHPATDGPKKPPK